MIEIHENQPWVALCGVVVTGQRPPQVGFTVLHLNAVDIRTACRH